MPHNAGQCKHLGLNIFSKYTLSNIIKLHFMKSKTDIAQICLISICCAQDCDKQIQESTLYLHITSAVTPFSSMYASDVCDCELVRYEYDYAFDKTGIWLLLLDLTLLRIFNYLIYSFKENHSSVEPNHTR